MFQAALAQAEELWDAAAVAGPASRPLPLFYCLSQAGRAACAAWTDGDDWRPNAHGLRRHVSEEPEPAARVLGYATSVTSQQLGIYSMVAAATASEIFVGQAAVADFWVSLPGFPTPRNIFEDRPRCLTLERVRTPGDTRPPFQRLLAATHGVFRGRDLDFANLPATYPTTQGLVQVESTHRDVFGTERPVFEFPREDGSLRQLNDVGITPFYAEGKLDYPYVVRPKFGSEPIGPPSEFLTLWGLLFCLSELARYYPDTWVQAIDPDSSPIATTLEHGLDLALERAPQLISDALDGPIPALMHEELLRLGEAGRTPSGEVADIDLPNT